MRIRLLERSQLYFTMLGLALVLTLTSCASAGPSNVIVPLPQNFEHKMGVVEIHVETAASVNQTITTIAAGELNRLAAVSSTGLLDKSKPLTSERVQEILSERAQKNLTFQGDGKVKLDLLVTEMSLPVLGRAQGLVGGGEQSTMVVMLSVHDLSDVLIGKYQYHSEHSPFSGRSRGFGVLDPLLTAATVVSSATTSDEDYIVAMAEDIINQILRQHHSG